MPKLSRKLAAQLSRDLAAQVNNALEPIYALRDFATHSRFETVAGGGEAGLASGFGVALFTQLLSLPLTIQKLLNRTDAGQGAGWQFYTMSTSDLRVSVIGSTGVQSPTERVVTSDVGRLHLMVLQTTGAALRFWVRRRLVGDMALSGLVAGDLTALGALRNGGEPATSFGHAGVLTWRGVLTDAQIEALFDAVRASVDVPTALDGAIITHRWSARDTLRLVPSGRGTVRRGLRGFSSASFYATAAGLGIRGVAGQPLTVVQRVQLAATTGNQVLACCCDNSAQNGWFLQVTGGALRMVMCSSGVQTVATYTLQTSDVGRDLLVCGQYTGTHVRLSLGTVGGTIAQVGSDVAAAFTPAGPAFPMYYGAWSPASQALSGSAFSLRGGLGLATLAELQRVADELYKCDELVAIAGLTSVRSYEPARDIVAAGDVVPAQVLDRVGTDNLGRSGSPIVAAIVAQGAKAPSALEDTATKAAVDRASRVGAPVVTEIDPSIDGRLVTGLRGMNEASYYQSAPGKGIRGAANALHVELDVSFDSMVSDGYKFLGGANDSTTGWLIVYQMLGGSTLGNVYLQAKESGNVARSTQQWGIAAANLNRRYHFLWSFDGVAWQAYVDGVPHGAPLASTGAYVPAPASVPMWFGNLPGNAPSGACVYGLAGGDRALTAVEVADRYQTWLRERRLTKGAKTEHLYLPEATTGGVPAPTMRDQAGSDELARLWPVSADARRMGPYSSSFFWQSGPGGGVTGSAGGFWVFAVPRFDKSPGLEQVASHGDTTTANWGIQCSGTTLRCILANGGYISGTTTIGPADLGVDFPVLLHFTGSVLRMHARGGAQQGTDVAAAFTPNAAHAMRLGGWHTQVFASGSVAMLSGGNAALTPAEVQSLFDQYAADPTKAPAIVGKTTRQFVIGGDVADAGGALPGRSVDRAGSGDILVRAGSSLVSAPRTERLCSWEAKPITRVGHGSSPSHRWATQNGKGIRGSTAALFVGALFRIRGSAGQRFLAHTNGDQSGWQLYCGSGAVQFIVTDNGVVNRNTTTSVTADGKLRAMLWCFDGAGISAYHARALATRSNFTGGYRVGLEALPDSWGGLHGATGNVDIDLVGYTGGSALVTLDEFRAWEDGCLSAEDVVSVPGKSEHTWSVNKRDASGNILDQLGDHHHLVVGSPTISDVYARAFTV